MGKTKLALGAAALLAGVSLYGVAQANTVTGSIWENTGGLDATPGNVPGTPADVTFSAPSSPLSFDSSGSTYYTIGSFLGTGGAFNVVYNGTAAPGDDLNNTLFNFVGNVSVTSGESFTIAHDDGVTLIIGGQTVIDDPGPTSAVDTTATYTGPSGVQSFQLVYAEVQGPPAVLYVDLPLNGVPEPSTWALMGLGFAGLGFAGFRARKTSVSIA